MPRWVIIIAALWLLASCAAPGARAPLVEGPVAKAAERAGELDAACRGRVLYVTVCTDCHGAVDPRSLSDERWNVIMPRMVKRADVEPGQEADLWAYVRATRAPATTQ